MVRSQVALEKPTPVVGGRRRSTRISSTGKKSSYFEDDVDDDSEDSARPRKIAKPSTNKRRSKVQGNGEDEDGDQYKEETGDGLDEDDGEANGDDDDDDDDDDDNDDDDDEPRVTFIPLPKLRDTGGVDYEDGRVHQNTMLFLKDLKANNKRSWLKMRDPEYRRSLKDWESFVESITEKIIEADETVPELPLKDVIFRIYRDIRFSKDQTPYKPHYSAAWSRTGRKGPYACYYIHAEPGQCFVGGGLWHPDNDALAKLRANIDERPHRIRRVLMNPVFRKTFLPNAKDNEKSVIAAFAESNKENALKTRPKGFHPEHRDLALLKLRNYTIGKKIKDSDLTAEDAQDTIMAIISAMVEYVTFLNRVVMPDPDMDSNSDNDDDEGEQEE